MKTVILQPKGEAMRMPLKPLHRYVERVEYPKSGGILTYFTGEPYPEKQLVYPEMFAILNPVKRSFLLPIRLAKSSWLAGILIVIGLLSKKLRKSFIYLYTDTFWSGLNFVALKPDFYCISVRGLRRALLPFVRAEITDFLCLFLEYDNAYRCRFQDLASILNKEDFCREPMKEARRVLQEYLKREQGPEVKKKAKLLSLFIWLLYLPKYRKKAIAFIQGLFLAKLKMDKGDEYWSLHRTDYNIYGMDLIDRMRRRSLMKLK